jgi:hypothetical protein
LTGEKYATVDLACRAFEAKLPAVVAKPLSALNTMPQAPRLIEEPEYIKESVPTKLSADSSLPSAPLSSFLSVTAFTDPSFPPAPSSIGPCLEEDPKSRLEMSLEQKKNVNWIRLPEVISQLIPTESDTAGEIKLFGQIDIHHLIQGVAGDCWLLATLACLAEFPEQIKRLFTNSPDGHGNVSSYETGVSVTGEYHIRIFDVSQLRWEVVTIDDKIPCLKIQGKFVPLFARPYKNEMWAVLIEKAMAKFIGSYAGISGGHEGFGLMSLTGFPQVYQFNRPNCSKDGEGEGSIDGVLTAVQGRWIRGWSQYNNRTEPSCGFRPTLDGQEYSNDQLFDKLCDYDSRDYLLAGSITHFKPPKTHSGFYREDGMVLGHAYSIIAVVEVPLGRADEYNVRLVQLRNPHGAGRLAEWKGDWCDTSALWTKYPAVKEKLDHVDSDDGVFWMPFEEFACIFDRLLVLCKPMGMQRDLARVSMHRESQVKKAELGRQTLGMVMRRVATYNSVDAIKRMSVQTYDPYLNVPDWIRADQRLLREWVEDKGHQL